MLGGKKNALFISVVNFNPSSNESFCGSKERNKIPTRNLYRRMFKQSCLQSIRAIFAYVRLSQRDDDAHNICPSVWLTTTAILLFFAAAAGPFLKRWWSHNFLINFIHQHHIRPPFALRWGSRFYITAPQQRSRQQSPVCLGWNIYIC